MTVHVLHHGRCFDGAASAALFADFYRRCVDEAATFVFRPKMHRTGDPYDPEDFAADVVASVDFRYSQHPALSWYFDHHRSAFQLPGDREHFDADVSGRKFHDESAASCAVLLARICGERFGWDASPHAELIRWTDTIDQARFSDPGVPVLFREPAMQIAAFVQVLQDPPTIARLAEDLLVLPLAELARRDYVQARLGPRLAQHREDMDLIAARSAIRDGVLEYDLLDAGPRVFSHFIPYYHHPTVRYVCGVYGHPDGDLRITVGYNPWLPPGEREHDLAALCERFGGGGHAHVGGVSLALHERDRCRRSFRAMLDALRAPPATGAPGPVDAAALPD